MVVVAKGFLPVTEIYPDHPGTSLLDLLLYNINCLWLL